MNTMRAFKFLIFAVLMSVAAAQTAATTKVSCRDEQGRAVDWFYLYKLPKHYSVDKHGDTSGLRYIYITSLDFDAWQLAGSKISERSSMPARTLQPLFDDATVQLSAYNDEFPNGTVISTHGHTKGVIATDGVTGIWFIHSVPKFPSIPQYEYPATGAHYGQSFLCLTLPQQEMQKVTEQLQYNEAKFYFTRLPYMLSEQFPYLERAVVDGVRTAEPYKSLRELQTVAGKKFVSFAKSSQFGKDLYADWVAPTLDVNLLVETWRDGAGNMLSNCTRSDKVYNIAEIAAAQLQISFKATTDHSKWAVSQATGLKLWRWRIGGADWICIGDINRQQHQMQRGGGTVCQKNSKVAKLYRNLVQRFQPCGEITVLKQGNA